MKLYCILKKSSLRREACDLSVNGAVVAHLVSGKRAEAQLPSHARYYISIGDKVYDALTVLTFEDEEATLTVTKGKQGYALDVTGARLEVLSLSRLLGALYDEGQISNLLPWERNAFFALLYAKCNREDTVLESPYLNEIREALLAVGDGEIAERLTRAMDACELSLPLPLMKKLTPEEETALVESYHVLWSEAERAPRGEELRSLLKVYDYIYEQHRACSQT